LIVESQEPDANISNPNRAKDLTDLLCPKLNLVSSVNELRTMIDELSKPAANHPFDNPINELEEPKLNIVHRLFFSIK
jgi:hypothetical protein